MLALDTDTLSPERYPGTQCLSVARGLGFTRFCLGTGRDELRGPDLVAFLRKRRLSVPAVLPPAIPALEGEPVPASTLLASAEPERRVRAAEALEACVALAARLSAAAVIVPLGTLRPGMVAGTTSLAASPTRSALLHHGLDSVLPALHALLRGFPEVSLAVEIPATPEGWPLPDEMEILLAELKLPGFGWWYDTSHGHRLGHQAGIAPTSWFDRFRRRLKGLTLADRGETEAGVPLGSGQVDFREVRDQVPAGLVHAMRLDPRYDLDALRESRTFLEDRGFG